ncbi:acyltransferase [Phenylobacterium sp.]|jgi:exopolysaccharide production protein ExoZ|uniref:acyltransferase family protein n=1 Tax=Phenylobacterium sp. TaxID=1871053 RepID=UPI002F3F8DCF
MDSRLRSLQVLRFFAALAVVWLHAWRVGRDVQGLPREGAPLELGHLGVHVFFVLSGVVIALTAPGKAPRDFLWSRLTRLVPLYFLVSAYQMLTGLAVGGFTWKPLVATVLFWPAYDGMTTPYLGIGWTLCFEMLFYVTAAAALARPRIGVPLALAAYGLAWAGRMALGGSTLQFLGHPFMLEFVAGLAIARLHRPQAVSPAAGALLLGVAAGLLAVMLGRGLHPMAQGLTAVLRGEGALEVAAVLGAPAALIVLGALQFEPQLKGAAWARLGHLGDASYALYLTHLFVVASLQAALSVAGWAPDAVLFTGVAMAGSVALSLAVHAKVERPMVRAIRGWRAPRMVLAAAG